MSVETMHKLLEEYHEAWGRGDQEAGMAFYSDDVILHMGGDGPLAGIYRGKQDFVDNWIGRVNAYVDRWQVGGEAEYEKDNVLLIGEDGVLMLVHEVWGRGDREAITKRLGFYKWAGREIVEC
ncbi:nuclear transport factor 2 family protein [Leucobacter japonicus]|uniref:nuclear transport factor 2 family protein n=1 Tax=Leucobacter japonicus TaxID=1461259 RepID=UPI0006A75990|nr:nuclear transport factor 2 family protein [Leucobacter japonicus]